MPKPHFEKMNELIMLGMSGLGVWFIVDYKMKKMEDSMNWNKGTCRIRKC